MIRWSRIGALLSGVLLLLLFWEALTEAQVQGNQWSAPYRLSSEGVSTSSNIAVADQYGYVHVFWVETELPDQRVIIQYARFDGKAWSASIDIHATQPSGKIELLSPAVDQQGDLHLIWTEGGSDRYKERPVYYSYAPAYDALSALHWSSPLRIDIPANLIRLQVDSKNVLHILYSKYREPQPGVYYLRSEDKGTTWSEPVWLDPDIPVGDLTPATLQFELDEADGLHAVWYYSPFGDRLIGGYWIRYAHSFDGGNTWSTPFTIDKDDEESGSRIGAPGPIMAVQDQAVHIVWGGGELLYRNHRFSKDAGRTWSASTAQIFGHLNGQAGDDLVIDGIGRIHFIGQIRYPQGIWHAYWDQGIWTPPSLVYLIARDSSEPKGARIHAHDLLSAIRAGNQLVITFHNPPSEEDRSLYTMHHTLDISPLVSAPTPTPKPTATSTPTPKPVTENAEPKATPRPKPTFPDTPVEGEHPPSYPLMVAVLPVLGVILLVVVMKQFLWRG